MFGYIGLVGRAHVGRKTGFKREKRETTRKQEKMYVSDLSVAGYQLYIFVNKHIPGVYCCAFHTNHTNTTVRTIPA